jgi:para-nitrobenzyl esterase
MGGLTYTRAPVCTRLLAGALAVLAACGAGLATRAVAASGAATAPTVVQTDRGPVQATPRGAIRSYFAIPYAAPPVGDLRWKPPAPAIV